MLRDLKYLYNRKEARTHRQKIHEYLFSIKISRTKYMKHSYFITVHIRCVYLWMSTHALALSIICLDMPSSVIEHLVWCICKRLFITVCFDLNMDKFGLKQMFILSMCQLDICSSQVVGNNQLIINRHTTYL